MDKKLFQPIFAPVFQPMLGGTMEQPSDFIDVLPMNIRVTEDGIPRITEDGIYRIGE